MPFGAAVEAGINFGLARSARKERKAAQRRARAHHGEAIKQGETQYQFVRDQYQQHRAIYGDVEADVYNFTKRLIQDGGERLKTQQLQRVQQGYQRSQSFRKARLAQAGISPDSGISIQQDISAFNERIQQEAQIEYQAPLQALQIGSAFVQAGAARDANLLSGIDSGSRSIIGARQGAAAAELGIAAGAAEREGVHTQQFLSAGKDALSSLVGGFNFGGGAGGGFSPHGGTDFSDYRNIGT